MRKTILVALMFVIAAVAGQAQQDDDAPAPPPKTITLRLLDGHNAKPVVPNSILVRADRKDAQHMDWAKMNDDGTATVTIPAAVKVIALQATYLNGMEYYVDCDTDKTMAAEGANGRWYDVDNIQKQGVATQNYCAGKKVSEKLQVFAKPGELVFFVRKISTGEQFKAD